MLFYFYNRGLLVVLLYEIFEFCLINFACVSISRLSLAAAAAIASASRTALSFSLIFHEISTS